VYVVDEAEHLTGVMSMRELVLCEADTMVADVMVDNVRSFDVDQRASELLRAFRKYRYTVFPVVDAAGVLVGVVTHDDALEVAEELADQELLHLTGIVGGEELRDMPFLRRSWRRLSWLTVNVVLNIIAASVIAVHQETLRAVIALAVFLPIISDMSGCSGNQAVAVSIRELSLDRVRPRDMLWVWGKELSVGLLNGLILGLICGGIAWLWRGNPWLGAIVGMAMWINTLVAVTIGGLVPLVLRRLRRDPALASGPILTTLTDACGFFVVLGLASRYLEHLI
jgi:magnesium transporter